jgi:hypothetical protein
LESLKYSPFYILNLDENNYTLYPIKMFSSLNCNHDVINNLNNNYAYHMGIYMILHIFTPSSTHNNDYIIENNKIVKENINRRLQVLDNEIGMLRVNHDKLKSFDIPNTITTATTNTINDSSTSTLTSSHTRIRTATGGIIHTIMLFLTIISFIGNGIFMIYVFWLTR